MTRLRTLGLMLISLLSVVTSVRAEEAPATAQSSTFKRQTDVIYGRLPGVALTMDVFTPAEGAKTKQNGAAVIWVVSGGWASAHESIDNQFLGKSLAELFIQPMTDRGYTVFAVVHGSQPKYTIPEILPQVNRAVRFIRFHAKDYGIEPDRIGIVGASAGGHLSLMQGMKPEPTNDKAPDPVDRVSSHVQAVAAFVPPTDFLNYGGEHVHALGAGPLGWLRAPFDFVELHTVPSTVFPGGQQAVYERVTDLRQLEDVGRQISPIYHVDKDDPPTFILAGEVDRLVPLQQAQSMKAKLDEMKVPNELFVRPKADHAWPEMGQDMQKVADWYDKYLKSAPQK
jgi:acetyl esterase/lipase